MGIVWEKREVTAEQVLAALGEGMTNATVRTLLRRIEAKGYLHHRVEGRTFVYAPLVDADAAATGALQRVLRRFYGGSVEQLVQGLLEGSDAGMSSGVPSPMHCVAMRTPSAVVAYSMCGSMGGMVPRTRDQPEAS